MTIVTRSLKVKYLRQILRFEFYQKSLPKNIPALRIFPNPTPAGRTHAPADCPESTEPARWGIVECTGHRFKGSSMDFWPETMLISW